MNAAGSVPRFALITAPVLTFLFTPHYRDDAIKENTVHERQKSLSNEFI